MIVFENFKIIKDGLDFSVYELIERDEYKKIGSYPQKTGEKISEWKHIAYRGSVKSAFNRVTELAIERGFNDMSNVNELIERIDLIMSKINKICK